MKTAKEFLHSIWFKEPVEGSIKLDDVIEAMELYKDHILKSKLCHRPRFGSELELVEDTLDWYYGCSKWNFPLLLEEQFDFTEESIDKVAKEHCEDCKNWLMIHSGYNKSPDDMDGPWILNDKNQILEMLYESRNKNRRSDPEK